MGAVESYIIRFFTDENGNVTVNNKALSKILAYVLIVTFFIIYQVYFLGNTRLIFAATPTPSPPTLSDSPDPQQGGSSVTFSFTCDDGANNVEGYVCKASDCANCLSGTTTNCWCASASVAADPSCTYACPTSGTTTNTYYGRCRSSAAEYTAITTATTFTCDGPPVFIQNESTPASPATYSSATNKSFSINITDPGGNTVVNGAIFQLGRNISKTYTNFTRCANGGQVACTWNDTPTSFKINFTAEVFDQAGTSNFTWFANDTLGGGNKTQTIQYTLNKAIPNLTLSNNTASVNTSRLVGYWRFEEGSGTTASDSSGNGNNGTLTNTPTWTTGMFGSGLLFNNNSNQYVDAGNNNVLKMESGEFTIAAWFKTTGAASEAIAGKGGGGTGGKRYALYINNVASCPTVGVVTIEIDDDTVKKNVCSTNAYNDGNWHFVVGVRNTTFLRLYIDGKEDSNSPLNIAGYGNIDSIRPFTIGSIYSEDLSSQATYFNGTIDEPQIWNRALTPSEIYEIYQSKSIYSTTTTFTGSNCPTASTGGADVTCNLYRNFTSVANPHAAILDVGFSYYVFNTSGGANYTTSTILLPINVSSGPPTFAGNESTPASPATFSSTANKSFSINISGQGLPVDSNGVIFQLGRNISSSYTNFTKCATPAGVACTWNSSPSLFIINFTAQTFDQAGVSNFTWFANDSSNNGNKTQTVQYVINQASQSASVSFSPASTVIYPNQTTTSCARVSGDSGSTLTLFKNGTNVASGTTSPQSETAIVGVGVYNYTCFISSTANYSSARSADNILTVNQNNTLTLTVTFSPSAFVAYGTSTTAQGNGCVSEVTCRLYRNDTLVATSPTTSETITLGVGNYSYVYNTSGNANYSSATSASTILSINKISPSLSVSFSPSSSETYPTSTTASCSRVAGDPGSTLTLFRNGTNVASGTSSPQSETLTLGSGNYNYSCTISATQNYTASSSLDNILTINSGIQSLSVSFSPGATTTYPIQTTTSCSRISGDSSATLTLIRDASNVASGTSSPQSENIRLGAATYNYSCTIGTTANYSANSTIDNNLVVSQNSSTANFMNLTLNSTETNRTYTYPAASNATGWFDSTAYVASPITFTLYRNSTTVGSTNPIKQETILAVGAYNYTYHTAGNTNYSTARKNYFLTISPASSSVTVSFSPSSTVYYPTSTTASCSRISGDSSSTLTLYRNSTQVATGSSSPTSEAAITLGAANYNYTCTQSSTENYSSSSSVENILIVTKGDTSTRLFLNGTEGNKAYSSGGWANFTGTVNISGKTVQITSSYPNFGTQQGTTPFSYEKRLISEGTFSVTADFNGDANYSSSSQSYNAIIALDCVLKGYAYYADTGIPITSGTATYIVKETGATDSAAITDGYFEIPCSLPDVPQNRVTIGIFINSSDNRAGYAQLITRGGPFAAETQSCVAKEWVFNGTATDTISGNPIGAGNVSVSVFGTSYSNTTHFSRGSWSINIYPCLISGELYTFQFAVTGENKVAVTFMKAVAK